MWDVRLVRAAGPLPGRSDRLAQAEPDAEGDPGERIEVVRWPLNDLDGALAATKDAKTIIGLLLLKQRR